MFIKIYLGNKPIFLCDKIDEDIREYVHHPDTILIEEVSNSAIKSLMHEIMKPEFHAGVLLDKDLNNLIASFFKHFTLVKAAGGLVLNIKKEVLLIFRKNKWDLPKGKLDLNETLEQCALREVEEETGLKNIELLKAITTTYHIYTEFGKHILKESHWYKMKYNGNKNPIPQTEEDITEVKWIDSVALNIYTQNTYPTIIDVLETVKN